ncbi:MAG: PAS domain S-box protein [Ramlibacter sp.]
MNSLHRLYERVLLAVVVTVVGIAAAMTWWDIAEDYDNTRLASSNLSLALTESMEGHFAATLRDAANAAVSAAALIEKTEGLLRHPNERRLHVDLRRALQDQASTARLLLTDAGGRVIASSAEYPVAPMTIAEATGSRWPAPHSGRMLSLGAPQRSLIDGEYILPYVCAVHDRHGATVGVVRAELRIKPFLETYRSIPSMVNGAVLVLSSDGVTLMRAPFVEDFLGKRGPGVAQFLQDAVAASSGNYEYTQPRDGVVRYVSWRRMKEKPLILMVGLSKDAVLAPWKLRAQRRIAVVAAACAAMALLTLALISYLRRLQSSRADLQDLERRYWSAMEHSTIGMAIASMEGQWQHVNAALVRMLGYSREELLAFPYGSLAAPAYHDAAMAALLDLQSGRLPVLDRETCLIHKDGHPVWVTIHVSRLEDAPGRPGNLLFHLRDITERKKAQQAVLDLNNELERRVELRTAELSRVNQDLEAFSYSAAHDLRGPLDRLAGYVEILIREMGEPSATVLRRVESVKRQVRHMTALIDDLLALASSSRVALHQKTVDMSVLVAEVREQLQADAEAELRNVQWIVAPSMPPVRADRALLREALVNLLGNALKYTRGRDPAVIEVGVIDTPPASPAVSFFIRDNGAGFDMAYSADLFLPFRRLHSVSEFEGTGIGLAIVQRIIERNGGRVWAEGVADAGATFGFTLPAGAPAAAVAAGPSAAAKP